MAISTALDQSLPANSSLPRDVCHHAGMEAHKKEPKVRMICEECGSENVMHDAWAVWDVDAQEWSLGAVFDYMHCDTCEGETHIVEVPLIPE